MTAPGRSGTPTEPVTRWLLVPEVEPSWAELLDQAERRRLARMREDAQRARFVGAAVLMRRVLAELADTDPRAVAIDRSCSDCGDAHGAPVPGGAAAGWHVSASHSGPYVVVAASARPVGVDVELVREELPGPAMLGRVLAPGEVAPSGPADLARLWTAKEAYLKAIGTGLATPMREVVVEGSTARLLGDGGAEGELRPLRPPVGEVAARASVCVLR